MSCSCGCCDGVHPVTPVAIINRPGLDAIRTRIGTQSSFLETMAARLSSADYPELAGLTTRDPSDASIALLDAWATVADVLTFYQERIANEGYLRTATERRSLVELARLIGYGPRPGVAASVFLAFTLDANSAPVVIPQGTKANSVPAPGETMEAFETSEDLTARFQWNAILPRQAAPQTQQAAIDDGLYLKGTATGLKPGSMLLIGHTGSADHQPFRVLAIEPDETAKRTKVSIAEWVSGKAIAFKRRIVTGKLFEALLTPVTRAPRGSAQLSRSVGISFAARGDTLPRLLASVEPGLGGGLLYSALRNALPAADQPLEVLAMRVEARPFGYNAPLKMVGLEETIEKQKEERDEKATDKNVVLKTPKFTEWGVNDREPAHRSTMISLDNDYEVAPDTHVVIERSYPVEQVTKAKEMSMSEAHPALKIINLPHVDVIRHQALAALGMSGKTLTLSWRDDHELWLSDDDDFSVVRAARVFLGSEKLALADAPIMTDVSGDTIELDGLYDGLDAGRWLIVEGERSDIPDGHGNAIPGIRATELVMLAGVEQNVSLSTKQAIMQPPAKAAMMTDGETGTLLPAETEAGTATPPAADPQDSDTSHTVLTLAASTAAGLAGLAYRYKRDTVTIYANVAHATHGETRQETMGSGNAAQALQTFVLRQPPLTHISARTPSGVASTLEVRVNDVQWHEAASLATLNPDDRKFTTKTGEDDRVAVIFGNGKRGSRLPTGRENITARYRNGIGAKGNVAARAISLLAARPLGVKDVINPIRASGGADREGVGAIRRNAPVALMALDRLLSTSDYADFARTFGGVGKASARRTRTGVEVVIAGVDDAPINESADVFVNLKDALHRFGDPMMPLTLKGRDRLSMVVQAEVGIDPDYLWEKVEPKVRAAMLAAFAFDAQDIGAPAFLSHALYAIQRVRGVTTVDITVFDAISAEQLQGKAAHPADGLTLKPRIGAENDQIVYLSRDVPDTLILQELKL